MAKAMVSTPCAQRRLCAVSSHLKTSARLQSFVSASEVAAGQDGPLAGVKVVEWTTAVQGPAAGQYLRDMGAEVIKIEGPVGDGNRHGRGTQNDLVRSAHSDCYNGRKLANCVVQCRPSTGSCSTATALRRRRTHAVARHLCGTSCCHYIACKALVSLVRGCFWHRSRVLAWSRSLLVSIWASAVSRLT